MKTKIRKYAKVVLASVLSLALVLQAFNGLSFVSEATTETVIYPTAETVTAGDASTNGVTDANISFVGFSGYPTASNEWSGYLAILTAVHSDITSGAITAAMTKNSAVVLQFTNPINVADYNRMTINLAMCGWSDPTAPSTTYIYASGASDLATENAIDTFTTDNNYNVTLDVNLNLTKYADADGYVRNLTFLCDSTVNYNYLFGAFRLSYEDVHADTVIYPTTETVTAGDASTNGVTDANISFVGFSGYPTASNEWSGYLAILTAVHSDITSGAITTAMTKNSAVVLQFTNPINVANHNRMTINLAMCGWSDPTAPSTTYIYASGASDLATENAIDTFTTDNNYNVTLDVNLDLTKYADADGYVRNLTFLCDSTVNYNYLFGAFRLSYEDVHAATVIYPTAETVTAGNASTNGVTDANITFTGFSGYPTADNAFAGYLAILTAKYSDITSGAITTAMTKNSAVVLQFTNPINVANHNRMTINLAMCGWSDPTAPSTTYIYASGASDLSTENAIDTFTTDNNYNVTLDVNLDLTKYADADGYVRNLTFLCDSTVNYNYLFGAFRLSYEAIEEVELTPITLDDFGIVYEEYTSTTCVASTTTTSLINTSFRGQVLFNKVNESSSDYYICYAAQGQGWDGMRIVPSSNGTLRLYDPYDLSCIDVTLTAPESLGSFVGTEFELGVDLWADGNDAKVVIYVNGEQYNTDAYVWTNAIANNRVGNNMNFIVSVSGDSIIVGEEQPLEQLPTDFMEITLNDFGFADGTYTEASVKNLGINGNATLDRKILSANISCVDENMQLFYGAQSTDWSGLYFLFCPNLNQIILTQGTAGTAYTFTASEGGFDLTNGNFVNIKITTEYVDGSAIDSDLKVGVFLNGVLYDNQYIIMSDFVASLSDGVSIHRADGANGSLTISTPKRMLPSNYDQKTFVDVGIGDLTDRTGQGTSLADTYIDWDGMIFSGKAAFATNGSEIRFGADSGGWVGSQLIMSDGKLTFNHAAGTFGNLAVWEDVTLGDVFSFSIVTQYVDIDGVDGENDLQLGLWVNGEMYGNRWFYIVDYTMYEGDTYAISFCMNGGTCTLMSYLPSTASGTQDNGKYYYNLAEGGYLLSTSEKISANGQEYSNGDVLNSAGDYTIVRTEGNAEYTSTVILYQTGDAHPDGQTTAADLVAIKKVVKQVELDTESGLKGADITKDNVVNDDDLEMIRDVLLGKASIDISVKVPSLSFASGDAKVMPIGGFYGPYGSLLTEDIYQKIKDSGINLITYSLDTYNKDGQTANVETQLQLAEQYGISLFVRDYALGNSEYTAQGLAEKINRYSMYESFKGITIDDEPGISGSYSNSDTDSYLMDYNYLSTAINTYGNLAGYTNLYPLDESLGDATAYENYLDEYCKTYNPKMLSFDDYPFNEGNSVKVTSCAQYFENLAMVRNKAMEYNIPFWTFVQAGKWYNTSSIFSSDLTQTQMKWNANMALAFGAKGIQYFPMVEPTDDATDFSGNGLIAADGTTTEWYTYAQNINAQIAAVDDVLMSSINQGVMIDGTYAENNINDCGVTILSSFNEVTGVTSNDTSYTEYGAVVGCFDYYGKTALYVVNYNTNGTNNVTLSFNGTCSTQTITSAGVTTASGTSLNVNLAAGEAALVVIE